jgi:hypothetical protein
VGIILGYAAESYLRLPWTKASTEAYYFSWSAGLYLLIGMVAGHLDKRFALSDRIEKASDAKSY